MGKVLRIEWIREFDQYRMDILSRRIGEDVTETDGSAVWEWWDSDAELGRLVRNSAFVSFVEDEG